MILYNGLVYSEGVFHTAIVTRGEKIVYIGDDETALNYSEERKNEECINLKGRVVLPGFIDSHAHGGRFLAMAKNKIDLSRENSVEKYLELISSYITENPQLDFYRGIGWQSPLFDEKGPSKELLDNICSTKPIVIKSAEGHSLWVNSKAIEIASVTENTLSPKGGVISKNDDGTLRGTFFDEAQNCIDAVTPDDEVEVYKEAIMEYQNMMVPYGYTSTTEMMMKKGSNLHKAYQELASEGKLLIKTMLSYMVTPDNSESVTKLLRDNEKVIGNKIIDGLYAKIFVDGVIEGATAWLKEPYSNMPEFYGEPLWADELLFRTCADLDNLGYDIHFHVIGDKAVEQMISAIEHVIKVNGDKKRRPVAAHVQLMDKADMPRMKAAGISVSANPYWFFKDETYTQLNEIPMLGERADQQFPMKSLADLGIVISAGSDFSITENPDPLLAIKFGMQRVAWDADADDKASSLNREECVDFDTMLNSVTINGAYTMNVDKYTGSLKVGKLADMVILDSNIFELPASEFANVNVDMTISEGTVVYERQ